MTWVVDDEEHVTQLKLPSNVIHAPAGSSLADMMAKGELVPGFAAAAGIGRTGAPTGGWKEVEADYPDLFPNAAQLEAGYFARSGVYPMHGTIVVKDSVLAANPWVAQSIFNAFAQAKKEWLAREIARAIEAPEVQWELLALVAVAKASTPEQMAQRMRGDITRWRAVIDKAGIPHQ